MVFGCLSRAPCFELHPVCSRPASAWTQHRQATVSEDADSTAGRYQIVVIGKEGAVLLDTATGLSWSLARDIDTLQLGWRLLEERWPGAVLHHAPEQPQSPLQEKPMSGKALLSRAVINGESAARWRPRFGAKWSRSRQPTADQP